MNMSDDERAKREDLVERLLGRNASEDQKKYTGSFEFQLFADFMAPIGEFVLAFSRVERWVTWSIAAFSDQELRDANSIEGAFQSFAARIRIWELVASHEVSGLGKRDELVQIRGELRKLNVFRTALLHNSYIGVQCGSSPQGRVLLKSRYDDRGGQKQYEVSIEDIKSHTRLALETISGVRRLTFAARPDFPNVVP